MEQKPKQRGGARPGAGRKRKMPELVFPTVAAVPDAAPPTAELKLTFPAVPGISNAAQPKKAHEPELVVGEMEPKEFLRQVMLGQIDATASQVSAAKGLMAYVHKKAEEEGKKEAALKKARETADGQRFSAPVPPGRPALKAA